MTGHYIVTGGAGFIGTHLIERLVQADFKVTVIDDFSNGDRGGQARFAGCDNLQLIDADIRDLPRLKDAFSDVDGIFHLAAKLSVQDCIADWLGHHSVNSTAMLGLFDLVRQVKPVPIVYASSAAVYGDRGGETCNEDMVARPISPYGADKLSCENHARAFWTIHGIPSFGLRLFNVYGPGQRSASPYAGVLSRFVSSIQSGRPPEIHGDGLQTRDFVYVSDVVNALVAAMARIARMPDALICNVCKGTSHTVRDLAYMIADILRVGPIRLLHGPARAGDIRQSCGDQNHMSRTLDLGPLVTLEQGLANWLGGQETVRKVS